VARISVEAIRREQILSAAIGLVAAKGYETTTIRDIAEAADVSTGTVNYYFEGKEDVLRSALVEASRRFRARLDSALAETATPLEALRAHAAAATPRTDAERRNQAVWVEFWARAQRDEQLRALHERVYDAWRRQLAATVAEGVAAGAFRSVEPEAWARHFAALVDGLALHVVLHPGSVSPDDMARAIDDHITSTLLPAA
jgi:AcrR family transcriptional regulator